jgi:hypothetical protein
MQRLSVALQTQQPETVAQSLYKAALGMALVLMETLTLRLAPLLNFSLVTRPMLILHL